MAINQWKLRDALQRYEQQQQKPPPTIELLRQAGVPYALWRAGVDYAEEEKWLRSLRQRFRETSSDR